MNTQKHGRSAPLRACTLFGFAALSGCGGGGADSPTSTPVTPAPASTNVNAAYLALVGQGHTFNLAGSTSTRQSVAATLSIGPSTPVTYSGATYDRSTLTSTTTSSTGAAIGTAVTTLWLSQSEHVQVFESNSADGTCVFSTSTELLPTSAALGEAGPYVVGKEYAGCAAPGTVTTLSISTGTVTQTWSYSAIAGTGYVCMTSSDAGFVGTSTEQDCFEVVDASGTLGSRARVTVTDLNGTVTTLASK